MIAAGVYVGRVARIIDLGTQPDSKFAPSRKLRFSFEIDAQMTDGKNFLVDKTYTASLATKSNLFKDLKAFANDLIAAAELTGDAVKIGDLLSRVAMIQVAPATSATGSEYSKVIGILAAPRGASGPIPTCESYYLSLESKEFNRQLFDKQPDFIKEQIEKSPEYAKLR